MRRRMTYMSLFDLRSELAPICILLKKRKRKRHDINQPPSTYAVAKVAQSGDDDLALIGLYLKVTMAVTKTMEPESSLISLPF
jgi:hypothetical protein